MSEAQCPGLIAATPADLHRTGNNAGSKQSGVSESFPLLRMDAGPYAYARLATCASSCAPPSAMNDAQDKSWTFSAVGAAGSPTYCTSAFTLGSCLRMPAISVLAIHCSLPICWPRNLARNSLGTAQLQKYVLHVHQTS